MTKIREHKLIIRSLQHGLRKMKAPPKRLGRPRTCSDEEIQKAMEAARREGRLSGAMTRAAADLGMSAKQIARRMKAFGKT